MFRKGQKWHTAAARTRSEKKWGCNSSADTWVRVGGGETGEESPVTQTDDHRCHPSAHGVSSGADIHLQPWRTHTSAGGHALKEASACGQPMLEQVFWQDLRPMWELTLEQSISEGPTLEQFMKEGPDTEQQNRMKGWQR